MAHNFFLSCTAINLCWFILSSFLALPFISVGSYFLPFLHCHQSLLVHTFFLSCTAIYLCWFLLPYILALPSIFVGLYFLPFWNWLSPMIAHTFFLSCNVIYLCWVHTFFLSQTDCHPWWFILSSFLALPSISVGSYFLSFFHCWISVLVHTFFHSCTAIHLCWFILSSFLKLTVTSDCSYFLPFLQCFLSLSGPYFLPFPNWLSPLVPLTSACSTCQREKV